jgi:hypothetical protein
VISSLRGSLGQPFGGRHHTLAALAGKSHYKVVAICHYSSLNKQ